MCRFLWLRYGFLPVLDLCTPLFLIFMTILSILALFPGKAISHLVILHNYNTTALSFPQFENRQPCPPFQFFGSMIHHCCSLNRSMTEIQILKFSLFPPKSHRKIWYSQFFSDHMHKTLNRKYSSHFFRLSLRKFRKHNICMISPTSFRLDKKRKKPVFFCIPKYSSNHRKNYTAVLMESNNNNTNQSNLSEITEKMKDTSIRSTRNAIGSSRNIANAANTWSNSLIGKFLPKNEEDIEVADVKDKLNQLWKNYKKRETRTVGKYLFVFKFKSQLDMKDVLKKSPWNVQRCLLALQEYTTEISYADYVFTKQEYNVQFKGLY